MPNINLLIIEDEDSQIQIFNDVIEQFNKKSELKIEHEICKSFTEGKVALETPFYDAAIIDLKLSATEELEGKKLVEEVYGKLRIPIVIYSGSIAQIDDIAETSLLKKRLRTENLTKILNEIIEIYNTGITELLRPLGEIDRMLTDIFWNHLVDDLNIWIEHNNPKTLLRYIFSHFQEYMNIDNEGDFEEYHPQEVYIAPPIKKNIHTGDLLEFEGEHYLVITPACDIVFQYKNNGTGGKEAFRKAENLVVIKAKEFDFKNMCVDKNGDVNKGKIKEFVTNSSYRYHFLPAFDKNDGFILDFQDVKSLSFENKIDIKTTITSSFIKDIISRFSLYYARQGQPTFFQNRIIDDLFAKSKAS